MLEDKSTKKDKARISKLDPYGQGKKLWINLMCYNINPRILSLKTSNKLIL
jgi:hypothetical protein